MPNYSESKYFDDGCVFCKIIKGDLASKIVKETEYCLAFYDAHPKAKTHILVVPKPHVTNILTIDRILMEEVLNMVKTLASELPALELGFRLINNCGTGGGQTVWHVHFHILAGGLQTF